MCVRACVNSGLGSGFCYHSVVQTISTLGYTLGTLPASKSLFTSSKEAVTVATYEREKRSVGTDGWTGGSFVVVHCVMK